MSDNRTLFFPVHGLVIDKNIGGELSIGRVIFIAAEKIPHVRKRLGIPDVVSNYEKVFKSRGGVFKESATYACVRTSRKQTKNELIEVRKLVQQAIWYLAASLYARCDRGRYEITMRPMPGKRLFESGLIFGSKKEEALRSYERMAPIEDYVYNRQQLKYMARHFFPGILKISNGQTPICGEWKQAIERAAKLAGRSYLACTLSDAFMYSMIAIETLLSDKGDKQKAVLIDRINALFGWVLKGKNHDWRKTVERLYSLRCDFVHDGYYNDLNGLDLFYAETILSNLLRNICKTPYRFKSKSSIVEFAKIIQAKKTLGKPAYNKKDSLSFSIKPLSASRKKELIEAKWSWE